MLEALPVLYPTSERARPDEHEGNVRETSRQQDAQCSTDSHSQSYSLMSLMLEPSVRVYLPESLCLYPFSARAVHDAPTFLERAPYFRGLLVMCQLG